MVGLRSPRTVQYSFERTWRRRLDRDAEVRSRERERDEGKENLMQKYCLFGSGEGGQGGDNCLSSEDKDKKTDIHRISIIECYLLLALSSLP